jgi:hypothetical protein
MLKRALKTCPLLLFVVAIGFINFAELCRRSGRQRPG